MIGIGATLNQRFVLDRELGRGGMGAVYRATDQVLQRNVAIKVLKEAGGEEVGKKIRLEAQILARLLHDNVVRLYDFGESEGAYFLVMEEVDGTSFSKRWRKLSLAERVRISAQVAEALNYAHHQGVIHRDVKPANVLLTAGDQAKLSDFGLSLLAEANDETGVIRGTPHYMSPEQARGRRTDYRTDLYSLGIMLYECATGSVPFVGQSMSVIAQQISAAPTPPRFKNPEISPALEALILGLLAKKPEDRPASGEVVARALREEADQERQRRPAAGPGVGSPGPAGGQTATVTRGLIDTPAEGAAGGAPRREATVDMPERSARAPATEPAPALAPAAAPAPRPAAAVKAASPLAREMLEAVLDEPVMLSADARYLCGHYLAYLLGGSRREGIFLARPLDPRNDNRGRLLLASAWLSVVGASEESIKKAALLLDERTDVRPALNPVVVMKYMAARANPARRKAFRQARKQLLAASTRAPKDMVDSKGVLNPGLMPQSLDDLRRIAPVRAEVDDQLVARWNRVSEVWRENPEFRAAVLGYATRRAHRDPASADLWPEVVYPLIERARWQRSFRPKHEAIWDYLSAKVMHRPDAGVRLDRMILKSVPAKVAEQLDEGLAAFDEEPRLDDDPAPAEAVGDDRLTSRISGDVSLEDLGADAGPRDRSLIRLTPPDPYRFTLGQLRDLWREAMAAMGKAGAGAGQRTVQVGPYRLAVVPSVRGRSAAQVVLQGMPNKQIELLTPSIRAGGSGGKPVIGIWVYQEGSAVIAYLDFKGNEKHIFWHAPNAQQFNYDDPAELNHMLYNLGMEAPDQLDRVLSRRFRPRSPAS